MKAIFKRDFESYFNSPIGYCFVAMILAVTGFFFYQYNCVGRAISLNSVFYDSVIVFIFVVPLLSVKMLCEDRKTKTDQILMTAPVTTSEIVLGKYFAALGVYGVSLLSTLIYVIVLALFGKPAYGEIITVYIGFALLGAAFISVGLFISSLTDNQFLGVLFSFITLFVMMMLSSLLSFIPIPFLKAVVGWFAISEKFSPFANCLLALDSIVYYISFSAVFIVLTIFSVEKRRWR